MNAQSLVRFPLAGVLAALIVTVLFQYLARMTAPGEFAPLPKTVPIDFGPRIIKSDPPPKTLVEKVKPPVLETTGGVKGLKNDERKVVSIVPPVFTKGGGIEIPRIPRTDGRGGLPAGADRSALPVYRRDPVYPQRAAYLNIEGWVRVRFDITATGAVSNAEAVAAEPLNTFEESALKAIASWRYKPQIEDGVAVEQRGMETVIRFQLQ